MKRTAPDDTRPPLEDAVAEALLPLEVTLGVILPHCEVRVLATLVSRVCRLFAEKWPLAVRVANEFTCFGWKGLHAQIARCVNLVEFDTRCALFSYVSRGRLVGPVSLAGLGATIPTFRHLTRLKLNNNYAHDDWLQTLTALEYLDLDDAPNVTGECFQHLKSLTTLKGYFCGDLATLAHLHGSLTYLNIRPRPLDDRHLAPLTRLQCLHINASANPGNTVTDAGIRCLTQLTRLDCIGTPFLTDYGLEPLVRLKRLHVGRNRNVMGAASSLTLALTHLIILGDGRFLPECLARLTKLTYLRIDPWLVNADYDHSIACLTNLVELHVPNINSITDVAIRPLRKLRVLAMSDAMTDDGLRACGARLTELQLGRNQYVTNKGIACLTRLTRLSLGENDSPLVDNGCLVTLTKLKVLRLENNRLITRDGLTHLTRLRVFDAGENYACWNYMSDDVDNSHVRRKLAF